MTKTEMEKWLDLLIEQVRILDEVKDNGTDCVLIHQTKDEIHFLDVRNVIKTLGAESELVYSEGLSPFPYCLSTMYKGYKLFAIYSKEPKFDDII